MRRHGLTLLVGLSGALCCAGIVVGILDEIASLLPIQIPSPLGLPALSLVGVLAALALRDPIRIAAALGIIGIGGGGLYGVILAVPGFNIDNYSVTRLNHALSYGLLAMFLSLFFVMIGMAFAFIVNLSVRDLND